MIQDTTNIFNTPSRSITARVELYNGSTLANTFTPTGALQEIVIERLGDTNKFFGFGTCQKATIKLVDKDRAINIDNSNSTKAYFSAGGDFITAYPTFYVEEVKRDENTNGLTITAYDGLYKASELTFADLDLDPPYKTVDVANASALTLGLNGIRTIDMFEHVFFEDVIVFRSGINVDGTEKLRDILNAIAEFTGSIYYVDKDNYLTFKRLPATMADGYQLIIEKADYFTLTSNKYRRIGELVLTNDLGNSISVVNENLQNSNEEYETQYIRNNPFYDVVSESNQTIILHNIVSSYYGLLYVEEFDLDWRGNFLLEYGDRLTIKTKDNRWIESYVLNDTITYNGGFKQKTSWSYEADNGETPNNPATLGEALKATFAKVDKANKEIELVAGEVAVLKLNTDGIQASVEELNKKVEATITPEEVEIIVKEQMGEGVDSITTATGFTFNAQGLTISKDEAETNTQITENGLTINSNDDEILLTVDKDGVQAKNLHATTFLIVGNTSRFEDYEYNGEARTGCFWIRLE